MMFKNMIVGLLVVLSMSLPACSKKEGPNTIKVGTISGPETQLMETAAKVALKRYGLHVKIIAFSDYNVPNQALSEGSIDANAFQHMPFLKAQIKARGYKIVPIGKTFLYPMGLYSKKIKRLSQLKPGSIVAIPNDPSNEARSLLLLQKAGLIRLRKGATINATPIDIASNPKHLKFVELGAPELPRALSDVALAAINTTYAIPSGLSPSKDALFTEGADSPYANIIAARVADKNSKKLRELVKASQSPQVVAEAKKLFGDGAVPVW